ncbi:alpha/beta hydrolase fold domain-containing protein [Nocardioides convexus]|uniref:alpha/beta hydrolase n=1 Tax=Nocardioides convexus TaxID=2712224 RepID=UPI002418928C|nr:alpha/beta hydrolase fold domain-containing protein [Nocardioides convexus]
MRRQNQRPARGSLRSRIAAEATSRTLRPLTTLVPASPRGVRFARRLVAGSLAVFGPGLPGSRVVRVVRPAGSGPTPRGEWVRGPGAEREDAVILYIHGSAYTICSARTHRGITSRLSQRTGLPVFACDYRLAPRHRFPAAADDVRAAYDWLIGEGHDPSRIVLAGDSAGGHLAVDLALEPDPPGPARARRTRRLLPRARPVDGAGGGPRADAPRPDDLRGPGRAPARPLPRRPGPEGAAATVLLRRRRPVPAQPRAGRRPGDARRRRDRVSPAAWSPPARRSGWRSGRTRCTSSRHSRGSSPRPTRPSTWPRSSSTNRLEVQRRRSALTLVKEA